MEQTIPQTSKILLVENKSYDRLVLQDFFPKIELNKYQVIKGKILKNTLQYLEQKNINLILSC